MAVRAAPFWRHKWLFLAVVVLTLVAAAAALVVLPVKYVAGGAVIVAEPDPGAVDQKTPVDQRTGDPADLESQLMILRSPRLLRLAAGQPGAKEAIAADCSASASKCELLTPDSSPLVDYLSARYAIGTAGRSRVIDIAYRSPLPAAAQTLANALINAFLDDQRDSLQDGRESAAKWMWQELAKLDTDIKAQDKQIEAYRAAHGLMRGASAPISSERLTSISQQLAAAQEAKAQADARLRQIRQDQSGSASSSTSVLDNRAIADLKQQIALTRRQLAAATSIYGPRHPQLRVQQDALNALQQQLSFETQKIVQSAQKDYAASADLVTSLQAQMKQATQAASTASSDEASIEAQVRDVGIKRQQYNDLYQKASALESERRSLQGGTRLVSLAELPTKPFFPKKAPFLGGGLLLGMVLGAAAVLLRERGFTRPGRRASAARDPLDVAPSHPRPERPAIGATAAAAILAVPSGEALPFVAELPHLGIVSAEADEHGELPALLSRASRQAAMQLALSTTLRDLMERGVGGAVKRLLVTSEMAGQAKTFATIAIGRLAAEHGLKVLAIECAPGRSDFGDAFAFTGEDGLSDIIERKANPAAIVQRGSIEGFHILPAGRGVVSFTQARTKRRLARLLDWAGSYDLVLLDGPVFNAETTELSKLVDAAVVCINDEDDADAESLAIGEPNKRMHCPVLGFLVTPLAPVHSAMLDGDPARDRRMA